MSTREETVAGNSCGKMRKGGSTQAAGNRIIIDEANQP